MNRPARYWIPARRAYTLVEILIATTLMLVMMLAVAQIFGWMGENINNSRATLEMSERLRGASTRLHQDLFNLTVTVDPPRRPESNEGYLEITEGPRGPVDDPALYPRNIESTFNVPGYPPEYDSTVIDNDDIVMFTMRSGDRPFVGRRAFIDSSGVLQEDTIESPVAEVAWFVRGRTLYRRVLLVAPQLRDVDFDLRSPMQHNDPPAVGFYANFDVSVHREGPPGGPFIAVANTLGDLTKPENRFAHGVLNPSGNPVDYPYHPYFVNPATTTPWTGIFLPGPAIGPSLGLPTLAECSDPDWVAGAPLPWVNLTRLPSGDPRYYFDAWANPYVWQELDRNTGAYSGTSGDFNDGSRLGEDVVLTDVVGFDVKVWDPNAPVLPGVRDDNNTPANLMDDAVIPGVAILPGDANYLLAFAHAVRALADPTDPYDGRFLPLGYGAYVDLNFLASYVSPPWPNPTTTGFNQPPLNRPLPLFWAAGNPMAGTQRVYDTWSLHYESDGINQNKNEQRTGAPPNITKVPAVDEGTSGFDEDIFGIDDDRDGFIDPNDRLEYDGIVDDPYELEAPPPYAVPLGGIQIKIRTFQPDSRQVREVTVVEQLR